MDLTQQKALNALEPYLVLSKSANSPLAAVDLITRATSAVNTFVFAELLETPNIQALRTASPEQASYVALLELFAWGTWSDYKCFYLSPPLGPLPLAPFLGPFSWPPRPSPGRGCQLLPNLQFSEKSSAIANAEY